MSVTARHPAYIDYEDTWFTLRCAYHGSGAVKNARDSYHTARGIKAAGTRFLPRPAGMRREEQYAAYKGRATWFGATERAVHGLTGTVFRREPQVVVPASLDVQLQDITQTGVPLASFAEEAIRETLLMGRFGVLVDFPQPELIQGEDGRVQEAAPPATSRPYWVAYKTEEIRNWRTIQRQGDTVLSLVVLRECIEEPKGPWGTEDFFVVQSITKYRVLRLNEAGIYEVSVWREYPSPSQRGTPDVTLEAVWIPTRQGEPLDFLPFVFMAPFSLEPHIEKSLLEALVEVNYQYYRHSADYEHGLHLTALPTPYITGYTPEGTTFEIGSATAWTIPNADARVGMLEFQGQGLQSHERALEMDIKNMAALGARLLEGAPLIPETATAVLRRTEGSESPVQALVGTVSAGLTQALQIHAWWAGVTENPADATVMVVLNKDLIATQAEPALLKVLMEMLLSGTISYETWYYNLQRGEIARPLISVTEEQALLEVREIERPTGQPIAA